MLSPARPAGQPKLSRIVSQLLESHGGGERYFDRLDASLRADGNLDILLRLFDPPPAHVAVSGAFGRRVLELRAQGRLKIGGNLLVFNGGLREGLRTRLLHCDDPFGPGPRSYTFVDDSFYSGLTARAIGRYLLRFDSSVANIVVAYDGSRVRRADVRSLYRYHDLH